MGLGLAQVQPWARAMIVRLRRRFPVINRGYHLALERARHWMHRDRD